MVWIRNQKRNFSKDETGTAINRYGAVPQHCLQRRQCKFLLGGGLGPFFVISFQSYRTYLRFSDNFFYRWKKKLGTYGTNLIKAWG
jgi:hypothetical protein